MTDTPNTPKHDEFGHLYATVTRPGDTRWAVSIYGDDESGWTAVLHTQDTGPPTGDSYEFDVGNHKDEAEEAFDEVRFLFSLADYNDLKAQREKEGTND